MQTMTCLYPTTALEDWVTELEARLRIYHPEQIKIDQIAHTFCIFIHHKPLLAFYEVVGRYRGITIDSRMSTDKQKEMFFHELCQILRHTGRQTMMPAAFRELQEWDARNFVRYAAIPHHMLKYIDLNNEHIIDQMVRLFKVTPELC